MSRIKAAFDRFLLVTLPALCTSCRVETGKSLGVALWG
jgi:hypothetical protein